MICLLKRLFGISLFLLIVCSLLIPGDVHAQETTNTPPVLEDPTNTPPVIEPPTAVPPTAVPPTAAPPRPDDNTGPAPTNTLRPPSGATRTPTLLAVTPRESPTASSTATRRANTRTPTRTPSETPTSSLTPTSTASPTATEIPPPTHTPTPTVAPLVKALTNPPIWAMFVVAFLLSSVVAFTGPVLHHEFVARKSPAVSQAKHAESLGALGAAATLPKFFAMNGGRVAIVGSANAGKTTLLHGLLQRVMADPSFTARIFLDGKGDALMPYAHLPGVTYLGPEEYPDWLKTLQDIVRDLPARYQKLIAEGKRKVEPGSARVLVVVDGFERVRDDPRFGREIVETLQLVADRPDALADVMLLVAQSAKLPLSHQDVPVRVDVVVTMSSEENPGAFTLQTSLNGPVVANGQARLVRAGDVKGL
ncbi:MAG: FtsK/SpoIIIE domain-containing protein [Chloroflexota bacterium]